MDPKEAYNLAIINGWNEIYEDICYQTSWYFAFKFSTNIYGANLLRYINSEKLIFDLSKETLIRTLKKWVQTVIESNVNSCKLLEAINKSNLHYDHKQQLEKHMNLIISEVILK